jgi:hypothetical protein
LAIVVAIGSDTLTRVEWGFAAGAVVAAVAMALLAAGPLAGSDGDDAHPVPGSGRIRR